MKPEKFQNIYETSNLDFEATYEKIVSIIPSAMKTTVSRALEHAGPISFRLPATQIKVLIFPKGPLNKIQVVWSDEEEKQHYLPKLKSLLVPVKGHKEVTLTPKHVSIIKLPYNSTSFTIAWCKHKITYVAPSLLSRIFLGSFVSTLLWLLMAMGFWWLFTGLPLH